MALGGRAEFGTSSTMLHTFLSAKKSPPVNCRLFIAPRLSKKNGSLRHPAKNRWSPPSVIRASTPIETGACSTIFWPSSPAVLASCPPHGTTLPLGFRFAIAKNALGRLCRRPNHHRYQFLVHKALQERTECC